MNKRLVFVLLIVFLTILACTYGTPRAEAQDNSVTTQVIDYCNANLEAVRIRVSANGQSAEYLCANFRTVGIPTPESFPAQGQFVDSVAILMGGQSGSAQAAGTGTPEPATPVRATTDQPQPAGLDFFAFQVERVTVQQVPALATMVAGDTGPSANDFYRLVEATNLEEGDNGVAFALSVTSEVTAQWDHRLGFKMMTSENATNTQTAIFTVAPDPTTYSQVFPGKGINLWVSGSAGSVLVNGEQRPLSIQPFAVALLSNGLPIQFNVSLEAGGYFSTQIMPDDVIIGDYEVSAIEGSNWTRLVKVADSFCAWAMQFYVISTTGNLQFAFPQCWQMNLSGTGELVLSVQPDSMGYSDSDTLGNGLALWPTGSNAELCVTTTPDQTCTNWLPLDTGSPGVNMPEGGGVKYLHFRLGANGTDGVIEMPYGETRNNVQPQL
ncbi:hypothetical protein C4579_01085 [Candidatus Microgenomates bacterium]|nr:MAG: hypothetical protein C4579_01085 [Candidatus Microgenomates bacterium]